MANQLNKKGKLIHAVVIVVMIGIALGAFYIISNMNIVTTDDAYLEGRIHSIAPKISGTVSQVHVEDNQNVKKGELLIEIDPADYEAKVNEAEAKWEAEEARLVDAEANINSTIANLQMKVTSLHQALLDKNRAEALYKDAVMPKEKYEKVITAYDLAVNALKAAKEQLKKARSLKDLELSLIKEKKAALETAQLNLSYTKIYSPADGYVTEKSVEAGNQVQPSQPLMAIVALRDIWVVANYKETQLKNVRVGQKVRIKVDTYPGKIFTGRVDSIMAGTGAAFSLFPPENALGNYVKVVQRIPVKIIFDKSTDSRHILRVGMSVVPQIITKDEQGK